MRVITTGKITIPFATIDVTLGIDLPSIKITNKEGDGQMQLVFASDMERKKLVENLQCLKIEGRNGDCIGTYDRKRLVVSN